ncbi:MAG TPA: Gfo/Idh/MocA family oxidoreductase, partial [Anaerolineales bacterium]|nr:Gfo/Idh/MocA family oxidoreductase [Anaerolineales bacterium]
MTPDKEFRSRFFARAPRFNYLPDQDRYLMAIEQPKYRFNVIGVGINGQEHMRVTMLEGRATINGVYDPNPRSVAVAQKIAAMFGNEDLVVYDSLEAACQDPEVDGLIISTPNYTHIDVLRTAIKSGKHILLEKPMATTILDAYEMTQMAADYPAVFQVGLQYRYKAMYVEAIYEALERQSIGEVKTISILEHRIPFLDKVNQWNKFSKFSGGTLVEKCCHYFDLMNLFAQARPARVFGTGSMAVNFKNFEYQGMKSDILDNAFVTVDYDNGVRANFNLCMFAPMFYEEMILCGDRGRLKVFEQEDFMAAGGATAGKRTGIEVLCGENHPARFGAPAYPGMVEETGHNGATIFEHINFVNNIEGQPTNTATVEEGFWAVVIGAAAEEAVKRGAVVEIDELLK